MWAVAGASFAIQVVLGSFRRAPSWDEAIYLSQVTRGVPALPFAASRARGITLLVAPLSSVGAPLWLVRLCLALVAAVALALVYRLWIPLVHWGAPLGAGLFAFSWPVCFYASEVMPNLWSALLGVAATGLVARELARAEHATPRSVAGVLAAIGFMGMIRPPDAVVLGVTLCIAVVALRGSVRLVVGIVAGAVIGVLPWLVEMSVRYGGPIEAVHSAAEVSHVAGGAGGIGQQLALTDGPLLGPDPSGALPLAGSLWWIGLVVLVVVAIRHRPDRSWNVAVRLSAAGGVALGAEYLFLIDGLAPRFLLPALALSSLAAGCGLEVARKAEGTGRIVAAATAFLLVGWTVWQVATFDRLERIAAAERAAPELVGRAIGTRASDRCVVASTDDYPQVAFAARCEGRPLVRTVEDARRAVDRSEPGWSVVLAGRGDLPEVSGVERIELPVDDWVAYRIDELPGG